MLFKSGNRKLTLPTKETAIPDRVDSVTFSPTHYVSGNRIVEPVPDNLEKLALGMGCFWGAERLFWSQPGVYSTAVGYAGGITKHPSYEDVCSGLTAHTEVVLLFYNPIEVSIQSLLTIFWESHNPTEGMRQGNDIGTQYRSAIYATNQAQLDASLGGVPRAQAALNLKGYKEITTEIRRLDEFYYAEDYHQQYLAKNPAGYCGLAGTGISYQPEVS